MKLCKRIVSLGLAIFLFLSIFSMNASAATVRKTGIGFVSASSLRLRSGPGSGYTTVSYASKDEVVILLGKSGDWYKVIYNLKEGYMHSDWLKASAKENAELGWGSVNGSNVNIRSGPSTSYSSMGKTGIGSKVYIIGINNEWFKVIYGENVGYIRSDFVDLTEIPCENKASKKEPLFFVGGKTTGIAPSAAALRGVDASGIIATAKKYIGVPYVWGGSGPAGFDCSGFVQYVFRQHGITLPRTSKEQYAAGKSVKKSELKPGDLVFFATDYTTVNHLGIYVGDGQFIHASSSKGITITSMSNSYWQTRYYGARRVL